MKHTHYAQQNISTHSMVFRIT